MKTECYVLLDMPFEQGQTVVVSPGNILSSTFVYEGTMIIEFPDLYGHPVRSVGRLLNGSPAMVEIIVGKGAAGLPITPNGGDLRVYLKPRNSPMQKPSPTEILSAEFAEPLGLTEPIIEPGVKIDAAMAKWLAERFGTTMEFWTNLQRNYDLHTTQQVWRSSADSTG